MSNHFIPLDLITINQCVLKENNEQQQQLGEQDDHQKSHGIQSNNTSVLYPHTMNTPSTIVTTTIGFVSSSKSKSSSKVNTKLLSIIMNNQEINYCLLTNIAIYVNDKIILDQMKHTLCRELFINNCHRKNQILLSEKTEFKFTNRELKSFVSKQCMEYVCSLLIEKNILFYKQQCLELSSSVKLHQQHQPLTIHYNKQQEQLLASTIHDNYVITLGIEFLLKKDKLIEGVSYSNESSKQEYSYIMKMKCF